MNRKPILYIPVGIQASGKTMFYNEFLKQDGIKYVSRDDIRFSVLKNSEEYFSHEKEVFDLFTREIVSILNSGYDVYADATHINSKSRNKLISAIECQHPEDYFIVFIYFKPVLYESIQRNLLRDGIKFVPARAIIDAYNNITRPNISESNRAIEVCTIENNDNFEDIITKINPTSAEDERHNIAKNNTIDISMIKRKKLKYENDTLSETCEPVNGMVIFNIMNGIHLKCTIESMVMSNDLSYIGSALKPF